MLQRWAAHSSIGARRRLSCYAWLQPQTGASDHEPTRGTTGDRGTGAAPSSARLAHRLIVSLDEDADEAPAEVERAWEAEIRRRVVELEAGTAELIPAEQVFAELRARG